MMLRQLRDGGVRRLSGKSAGSGLGQSIARGVSVASLLSLLLLGVLGCLLHEDTGRVGAMCYIEIRSQVTPLILYAQVGDEIRWHNVSPNPVRVGILDNKWRVHVVC